MSAQILVYQEHISCSYVLGGRGGHGGHGGLLNALIMHILHI